jgi:hypothetical protein
VSNSTFYYQSRDGRLKAATIPAMTTLSDRHVPGFLGLGLIRFSSTPLQLRPDPASTAAGQQRNNACTSTTGDRTSATAPWIFHRPVINISTTPQGWPACTRAHRHNNTYSARPAFSSKAPLGFVVNLTLSLSL